MQSCAVCNTQSADIAQTCPKCGADLGVDSHHARALARLRANPRVTLIRVAVYDNCCPVCAQAQGAHPKEAAPRLPIEGCSHGLGCRCHYEPVLTDIYP